MGSPTRYCTNRIVRDSLIRLCLNRDMNILDVGCGNGDYARWLESILCREITYLGIDRYQNTAWGSSNNRFQFKIYDAEKLKELNQKFNLILALQSLEHIANDAKVIQGMEVCLEDNGVIVISVPSKYSFMLYLHHGLRRYSIRGIEALIKESNLRIDKLLSVGGLMSFKLHFTLWTIPMILGVKLWEFYSKHKSISSLISGLERISIIVDKVLRLMPGGYVAILSKGVK